MRYPLTSLFLIGLLFDARVEARVLRVGVENNSPPLSFLDANQRPAGFSAELLQAMNATGKVQIDGDITAARLKTSG